VRCFPVWMGVLPEPIYSYSGFPKLPVRIALSSEATLGFGTSLLGSLRSTLGFQDQELINSKVSFSPTSLFPSACRQRQQRGRQHEYLTVCQACKSPIPLIMEMQPTARCSFSLPHCCLRQRAEGNNEVGENLISLFPPFCC